MRRAEPDLEQIKTLRDALLDAKYAMARARETHVTTLRIVAEDGLDWINRRLSELADAPRDWGAYQTKIRARKTARVWMRKKRAREEAR